MSHLNIQGHVTLRPTANHHLQGMVLKPRASTRDPRIAKTGELKRSKGDDGKLYMMLDKKDWNRYHVLFDQEVEEEERRSIEIEKAVMKSTGRIRPHSASSPSRYQIHNGPTATSVSPLRTRPHSANDSSHNHQSHLQHSKSVNHTMPTHHPQSQQGMGIAMTDSNHHNYHHTHPQQRTQHRHSAENLNHTNTVGSSPPYRYTSPHNQGQRSVTQTQQPQQQYQKQQSQRDHYNNNNNNNNSHNNHPSTSSSSSPVVLTMGALRAKYEQNLDVIEQLYREKRSLEDRVRSLDYQLQHPYSRAMLPGAEDLRRGGRRQTDSISPARPSSTESETYYHHSHDRNRDDHQQQQPQPQHQRSPSPPPPYDSEYPSTSLRGQSGTHPGPVSRSHSAERSSSSLPPSPSQEGIMTVRRSRDRSPTATSHMSPVATVMEALKVKHEQNMEVIERLYGEIKSLRAKARSLEMQIRHGEILRGEREGEGEEKQSSHRSSSSRGHRRRDEDDGDDDERYESDGRGEGRRRRRHDRSDGDRDGDRDRRYDDEDRDRDNDRAENGRDRRYDDDYDHSRKRRGNGRRDDDSVSSSGSHPYNRDTRTSFSSFVISPQLQADQERYLQRLKESQRRETQKQREQARYEAMIAQRFVRASQRDLGSSSEFTGMRQREGEAEVRNARRKHLQEEKQRKQQEEEERQRLVQREKMALLQAKIESGEQLSWQEMEDRNRNEREARAAARQEELLATAQSFEFAKGSDGVYRKMTNEKFYPDFYGPPKSFVAKDPETVVETLKQKQELFVKQTQQVLEQQKKERREAAAKLLGVSTSKTFENVTYHGTEGMVKRLIDSKQKQLLRDKEKKEKEEKEIRQQLEADREAKEKWLNAKPPEDARKIPNLRADVVQAKKQEDAKAQAKLQEARDKKAKAERELGRILAQDIADREACRKAEHGTFVEPSAAKEAAEQKKQQAAAEYRENLRVNAAKLKKVQDERPTLLQRHDMETAKRNSASAALNKIARIIPMDDDIFDENQKIQLGCIGGNNDHPDDDEGQEITKNNKGKKGNGRGEERGGHK